LGVWTIRINSIITIILIGFLLISSLGVSAASINQEIESVDNINIVNTRALAGSPWPMFRGNPKHTGLSSYDTSGNNGDLRWKFKTGQGTSSPVIGTDGTIYVGGGDNYTYAINPDGSLKWKYEANKGFISSPTISDDGIIYIGAQDYYFYAINPDGTLKWKFRTYSAFNSSAVISDEGTIYVGSENIYAINPDGTQKWVFETNHGIFSSPALGDEGTIYVGSFDRQLYAINPNGKLKWKYEVGGLLIYSSPAIDSNGIIYIGTSYPDNTLYAINPDGTLKWEYKTKSSIYSSPAIDSSGTIYICPEYSNLLAINPDGTLEWEFEIKKGVFASPAIGAEGTIYLGSHDSNLYAIYPNGTLKWKFGTEDRIFSSPAIGTDGVIYFGSNDGHLYAIGTFPPDPPQNLCLNVGDSYVLLSWEAPENDGGDPIKYYKIYKCLEGEPKELLRINVASQTLYNDTDVKNNQVYYYQVSAENSIGESKKSDRIDAEPKELKTSKNELLESYYLLIILIIIFIIILIILILYVRKRRSKQKNVTDLTTDQLHQTNLQSHQLFMGTTNKDYFNQYNPQQQSTQLGYYQQQTSLSQYPQQQIQLPQFPQYKCELCNAIIFDPNRCPNCGWIRQL